MDVMFKTLLIVFVLTAIAATLAMLPSGSVSPSLAIALDFVPIIGVVVAAMIAAVHLKRTTPTTPVRLLITIYSYFAGGLVGALGLNHLAAVVIEAIKQGHRQQFIYDFRFYSLVLLGALLIATGIAASVVATGLARGERAAWRVSLSVWIIILAVNLPLVPLQGFAVAFSVLAALALLLLGGMRKHFYIKQAEVT
jgi:hypothetical protein